MNVHKFVINNSLKALNSLGKSLGMVKLRFLTPYTANKMQN